MSIEFIDWMIIILYIVLTLIIGLWYKKQAGKSLSEFFLGGRNLPWFLAGISMVATTFAADTPLAITELMNKNGISGNWLWWNFLIGGMLTTFFFAKLWRRANVLTELELIEFRYSGKAASFLRGFKALYLGLVINSLFIGWVNLALVSILTVLFDIPRDKVIWFVALAMFISAFYSALSGLKGVAVTDAFQFIIATIGAIILAVLVVSSEQIGGIRGLIDKLPEGSLNFFPNLDSSSGNGGIASTLTVSLSTLLAFIGVQWWATMYPGAEPGGGGFIAQRMMSTRNEKDSFLATMFFQVAHYTLRPWPWILVGLATIILYPHQAEDQTRLGYVMAIKDFAPIGFRGLITVSLLAAYMSTISTALNLSASYLVNDFYKRFLKPIQKFRDENQADKHYVFVSRITTGLVMVISLYITTLFTSISQIWMVVLEGTAGLGLVMILRWYWWRVNAWSEITATIVPLVVFVLSKFVWEIEFPQSLFLTVGTTTILWLTITFATKPTDSKVLNDFYMRVKPAFGWATIVKNLNIKPEKSHVLYSGLSLLLSISMTFGLLFFTGKVIFYEFEEALVWFSVTALSFAGLWVTSRKAQLW